MFWNRAGGGLHLRQAFAVAGELAGAALPADTEPKEKQAQALEQYAKRLNIDLTLFSKNKELVASTAKRIPKPPENRLHSGFLRGRGGPAWAIALPDGRWLVARSPRRRRHRPGFQLIVFLGAIALAVGAVAWPIVRGLTRRLERLQTGVEQLGEGDLSARVEVEGRDEVARLATGFNAAASRIEDLMKSHKLLLANASHELRTPLSRIRLGIDMLEKNPNAARRNSLSRDIAELDSLIEEILLLSRLDGEHEIEEFENVDLLALAAEEAVNYEQCDTTGTPLEISASPRLIRRMIRNLLDNASKHGMPPIKVTVEHRNGLAVIKVCDNGPGIPPTQIENVFEPFHRGATQGTTGGTGLGLALVRRIAKRHNGTVRVTNNTNGDRLNSFEVELPLQPRKA